MCKRPLRARGIRHQDNPWRHLDSIAFQFNEFQPDEKWMLLIERRARELERLHPGKLNDCQIVAEAEASRTSAMRIPPRPSLLRSVRSMPRGARPRCAPCTTGSRPPHLPSDKSRFYSRGTGPFTDG